jgi:ABC-2 type transport system ATP-binding protein
LSTHILEEVEAVCSRAIIIGNGKIVADGSPHELRSRSVLHGAVTLELLGVERDQALAELRTIEGVESVRDLTDEDAERPPSAATAPEGGGTAGSEASPPAKGRPLRVRLFPKKGAAIAPEAARFVHSRTWQVDAFTLEKGDLNEVFYSLTKGGTQA